MSLDLEIDPTMQVASLNDIARNIKGVSLETRESFPERVCSFDRTKNRIEITFGTEKITFDSTMVSSFELDPLTFGPHLLYSIVIEFAVDGIRVGGYRIIVGLPSSLPWLKDSLKRIGDVLGVAIIDSSYRSIPGFEEFRKAMGYES